MHRVFWGFICVLVLGSGLTGCVMGDELDPINEPIVQPPAPDISGEVVTDTETVVAPETLENGLPKVLDGQPTLERPEIGAISLNGGGFCTATLIRHNIAITASHCVDFRSQTRRGNYGTFIITSGSGQESRYTIELVYAFNSQQSELDIALLHLSESVPTSVATPTQIATREASRGEQVAIFGYGCTNRNGGGGLAKRKFTYNYSDSFNLCSGDSGGPVVIGSNGPVFLINSGYIIGSGKDLFGEAYNYRQNLIEQIVAWNGSDDNVDPEPVAGITVTNGTGTGLWVHCGASASSKCSEWQFLEPGSAAFVMTPDRGVYLWNLRMGAQVEFNLRRVVAPQDEVTVFANGNNPFVEPADEQQQPIDPEPLPEDTLPAGTIEITNNTGATLWIHCSQSQVSATCDGWSKVNNGSTVQVKTPDRRIYLWNANQPLSEVWDRYLVTAPSNRVTIHLNTADPFNPR